MRTLSDKEMQTLVSDFYTESHEDIVGLFAIAQAVEDLIDNAKGMLAGDSPYHAGGYRPWPDQERTAVMHRIRREWMELGHSPSIPDIVWFGPPKKG